MAVFTEYKMYVDPREIKTFDDDIFQYRVYKGGKWVSYEYKWVTNRTIDSF